MQTGAPSRTALAVAFHRAAHQVLENGRIFSDPLALRILGEDAAPAVRQAEEDPSRRRMRMFIAVRHRFAEDAIAAAAEHGLTQLVVLGAGLDTYACRSPFRDRLRLFEVDHPATQAWKREKLAESNIPVPASLTFVPIDFERESLPGALAAAGFDPTRETFFTWLGVVPYLTQDAFQKTLRFIASVPGGAHVVFDYSDPPDTLSPETRAGHALVAARVAAIGEPWINFFEAKDLRTRLLALGFTEIEDLGPREIAARYFPRATAIPELGGHIALAATAAM